MCLAALLLRMLLLKLNFAVTVSFLPIFSHLASGQFPAACTDNANNGIKVCCPSDCSGPDHGNCTSISASDWSSIQEPGKTFVNNINRVGETLKKIDTRYQWPTEVFTSVCVCGSHYAGPDCSECDFGYRMDSNGDCQEISPPRERKSITALSVQERTDLIRVLDESKNERQSDYKWAVIVEEPDHATRSGLRLENVSTYDLFVYQHFFSKRDGDVKEDNDPVCSDFSVSDVDFAHGGPTFLTWHRYYLLIVERELGRIAERLGSPNGWKRYTFALPYWDWDDSDEVKTEIFSRSYFGTFDFDPDSNRTPVEGVLFDDNKWPTVCDRHYDVNVNHATPINCSEIRSVCNPNTDRTKASRLERGKFTLRGNDPPSDSRDLPDLSTIKYLLSTNTYDAEVRNMANHYGGDSAGISFRNRLEGFVNIINTETGEFAGSGSESSHNNFHNAVHIFIHGHMRIVPSASNDPIFYLHHANVDRLFEAWLQGCGGETSFVPQNRVAHPGHNGQDYLVPFFPLKTNNDMYKKSAEFGYTYQELDQEAMCPTDGPTDGPTDAPTDGPTDGSTDGPTDGPADGPTNSQNKSKLNFVSNKFLVHTYCALHDMYTCHVETKFQIL